MMGIYAMFIKEGDAPPMLIKTRDNNVNYLKGQGAQGPEYGRMSSEEVNGSGWHKNLSKRYERSE